MDVSYTMESTYRIQLDGGDGGWEFCSQQEFWTEAEARETASRMYDGQVRSRIVRVDRTALG